MWLEGSCNMYSKIKFYASVLLRNVMLYNWIIILQVRYVCSYDSFS